MILFNVSGENTSTTLCCSAFLQLTIMYPTVDYCTSINNQSIISWRSDLLQTHSNPFASSFLVGFWAGGVKQIHGVCNHFPLTFPVVVTAVPLMMPCLRLVTYHTQSSFPASSAVVPVSPSSVVAAPAVSEDVVSSLSSTACLSFRLPIAPAKSNAMLLFFPFSSSFMIMYVLKRVIVSYPCPTARNNFEAHSPLLHRNDFTPIWFNFLLLIPITTAPTNHSTRHYRYLRERNRYHHIARPLQVPVPHRGPPTLWLLPKFPHLIRELYTNSCQTGESACNQY